MKINQKMINGAILFILVLVVLFKVLASTIPLAQDEATLLGDESRCESALGCYYNTTNAKDGGECSLSEVLQNESCVGDYEDAKIPLSSLFSSSGVVFLIIMVSFLLIVLTSFLGNKK